MKQMTEAEEGMQEFGSLELQRVAHAAAAALEGPAEC